jgi:hypothetical protein
MAKYENPYKDECFDSKGFLAEESNPYSNLSIFVKNELEKISK